MIQLDHFTYTYPGASRPALNDVSLSVPDGAFALVTGPSGAGKSTLLRALNGLVPHFSGGRAEGRVRVAGLDPLAEGPARLSRVVGFVFQDPEAQFVVNRVEDEVVFALENAGMPLAAMEQRVEEALALLDLSAMRRRSLEHLSGGEMQRVAVAAALALRPRVLVLDEPSSQLDPQSADELLNALVRLNRELGLTVVLSEHRLERVAAYASQVIYLDGPMGAALSGPPRQVFAQIDLSPPVASLGRAMGWQPLPLTVEEARPFVAPGAPDQGANKRSGKQNEAGRAGDEPVVLQVEGLQVSYGQQQVLDRLNLTVRAGEIVALMGRNGAGKTSLLRAIVGLLNPQGGAVAINGRPIAGRSVADICREVGYLPQNPNALLFADTVQDELLVTLRNHGLKPDLAWMKALIQQLGLGELADAYPRDLSAGQRQRVAMAAVVVTRPRLLLLDEPTRGLDYQAKAAMTSMLQAWRDEGLALLLVTHDVEWVALLADRAAVLEAGRIGAEGPLADVLSGSPVFAPQIAQLLPGRGCLTVDDACGLLDARRSGQGVL